VRLLLLSLSLLLSLLLLSYLSYLSYLSLLLLLTWSQYTAQLHALSAEMSLQKEL
jgi:hypothetical protein